MKVLCQQTVTESERCPQQRQHNPELLFPLQSNYLLGVDRPALTLVRPICNRRLLSTVRHLAHHRSALVEANRKSRMFGIGQGPKVNEDDG